MSSFNNTNNYSQYNYHEFNKIYFNYWNIQPNNLNILEQYKNQPLSLMKNNIARFNFYAYSTKSLYYKLFYKKNFFNVGIHNLIDLTTRYELNLRKLFEYDIFSCARKFVADYNKTSFHFIKKDIYEQALRNLGVMNILQLYFRKELSYSKQMFAYNMLYLITDNYFDDPKITFDEKKDFSERFKKKILGEYTNSNNEVEEKVFRYIDLIEQANPRTNYKELYYILCSLQNSQEYGFYLCFNPLQNDYENNILKISIEKGGFAVLSDGLILNKHLNLHDKEILYGFGSILQFLDDLLDLKSDLKSNNVTIFTLDIKNNLLLDFSIVKLINYVFDFLDNIKLDDDLIYLKGIFIEIFMLFLYECIEENSKFISKEFLKEFKQYSFFSNSYIKKLSKTIHKEIQYFIFSS